MVDNRLPAVRELESADPDGRREWSRVCKEKRRGKMDGTSGYWRLLGLSGTPLGRRTLTVNCGLLGDTREETLPRRPRRGLVSIILGLNSFLTRPPNRLTLLRKVRLSTEILATCGECSCRSPNDHEFVLSSPGESGRLSSSSRPSHWSGRLSSSSRPPRSASGDVGEGRYVATLSTLCVPGQLLERESWR
jgi:hypothetical protein